VRNLEVELCQNLLGPTDVAQADRAGKRLLAPAASCSRWTARAEVDEIKAPVGRMVVGCRPHSHA
jgi:hypothetical protein